MTSDEFRQRFVELAGDVDPASRSSVKSQALETFLTNALGLPAITVKWANIQNGIGNRIREAVGAGAQHLVIVANNTTLTATQGRASTTREGGLKWVVVALRDESGVVGVTDIYRRSDQSPPRLLVEAFPTAKVGILPASQSVEADNLFTTQSAEAPLRSGLQKVSSEYSGARREVLRDHPLADE